MNLLDITRREKAIAALNRQKPEGIVPAMDLDFQLAEEITGRRTIMDRAELEGVHGNKRKERLRENARIWVEVSEKLDLCMINGTQRLPTIEDELFTYEEIKRICGRSLSACMESENRCWKS